MILHVLFDRQKRLSAPLSAENKDRTASVLSDQLPVLRENGQVAVYVTDDAGVAHIIVAR